MRRSYTESLIRKHLVRRDKRGKRTVREDGSVRERGAYNWRADELDDMTQDAMVYIFQHLWGDGPLSRLLFRSIIHAEGEGIDRRAVCTRGLNSARRAVASEPLAPKHDRPAPPTCEGDPWQRANEAIDAMSATDALVARMLAQGDSVRQICEATGLSAVALRAKRNRLGRELAAVWPEIGERMLRAA